MKSLIYLEIVYSASNVCDSEVLYDGLERTFVLILFSQDILLCWLLPLLMVGEIE